MSRRGGIRGRAEDEEGRGGGRREGGRSRRRRRWREELRRIVIGVGIQTPRDAVVGLRLAGPAAGYASSAVLRPYICSPLGVGLAGAKGRAVR